MKKTLILFPVFYLAALIAQGQMSERIQDAGYKMQDAGYRMQDAGYKMQDLQFTNHQSPITNYQSPTPDPQSLYADTAYRIPDPGSRTKGPASHYTLAIGVGWSHYFANMDLVPARNVKKDFIGASFRFMWEPEYRLSLGLETGLYRIFRVDSTLTSEYTLDAKMYVVPLLLVIRMRIVDHFYLSVAPGLAVQFSQISGIGEKISSTQYSMSNFEGCASYLYPLSKHLIVGGEARIFHFGKTNDYIMSINAVFAVKL